MKHTAIAGIEFNGELLRTLQQGFQDRLGTLAVIKLVPAPNLEHQANKALEFLTHVFGILGFQVNDRIDFGETCECWVYWDDEYRISIRHKYWSLSRVVLFRSILESAAALYKWSYQETGDSSSDALFGAEWTTPYFGVTHIENCPKSHQITMNLYDDGMAKVYLIKFGSYEPFKGATVFYGAEPEARKKGETWLNELVAG